MAFFLSQFLFYLVIFYFDFILVLSSISISNLIVHIMFVCLFFFFFFFPTYNYEILVFYNILEIVFYEIVVKGKKVSLLINEIYVGLRA